jgi:predicted nucleic acid-binding Zn ribbon protein
MGSPFASLLATGGRFAQPGAERGLAASRCGAVVVGSGVPSRTRRASWTGPAADARAAP